MITDRVVGADASYALPVRTVTPDNALASLFTDNMFRPVPDDIGQAFLPKEVYPSGTAL